MIKTAWRRVRKRSYEHFMSGASVRFRADA
jgi:hypothetical protein